MTGDIIKSFLVGLGFDVDDKELANFNKAIASATTKVAALYGTIQVATAGIGYAISKVSEDFERLGYEYHIIAPAINKALLLRRELLGAYKAAGINISEVVRNSLQLNLSLTKTKFAFEALYKSVASRFFTTLTKQSDILRSKIYANMPKIQAVLERFVTFVFAAFDATIQFGTRLFSILSRIYEFFKQLHEATNGWSTVILAVVAAWRLLNLSFLATPFGMVLAGLTAIIAAYDDLMTFKEGGKSLFDWGPYIPFIDGVARAVRTTWGEVQALGEALGKVAASLYLLGHGNFRGAWDSLKAINDGPPIGGSEFQTFLNQKVSQQTNISISGVPDAQAAGRAVSNEQSRVNFDLVRNMKGSIRAGGILQ